MAKQNFYTYPSMEKQLKQWTVQYSADYFRLDSIGRTPAKRHLYACHLGAADAPKQLVLTASIHGREYINTTLLLDMLAYYLPRYNHRELPDAPWIFGTMSALPFFRWQIRTAYRSVRILLPKNGRKTVPVWI